MATLHCKNRFIENLIREKNVCYSIALREWRAYLRAIVDMKNEISVTTQISFDAVHIAD
jgi:hypothetical protein